MNREIMIVGAGRSATALIDYLLDQAAELDCTVVVADRDRGLAESKVAGHPRGRAMELEVNRPEACEAAVRSTTMVVSLLPPALHYRLAEACLKHRRHLATASYWSEGLLAYRPEVEARGLVFMGELGLDPGIDHMSARQKIDEIHDRGGRIHAFRSYTGGLVAPEDDDNPWHYKISWNPHNVVTAGSDGARFLSDGRVCYVPYHRIFQEYKLIEVPGWGSYEGYANRDSLKYRDIYDLRDAREILRGTLRSAGFCDAWNVLVQLGITGPGWQMPVGSRTSYRDLLASFSGRPAHLGVKDLIGPFIGRGEVDRIKEQLEWLGLLSEESVPAGVSSTAGALEHLLLKKWRLEGDQRDLVLMQHEFEYETPEGGKRKLLSTLAQKGENATRTAMTNLVGWPLGAFVKRFMHGEVSARGVLVPTQKEIYEPILKELADRGVVFQEHESGL